MNKKQHLELVLKIVSKALCPTWAPWGISQLLTIKQPFPMF